jgi:hypothetical protein
MGFAFVIVLALLMLGVERLVAMSRHHTARHRHRPIA